MNDFKTAVRKMFQNPADLTNQVVSVKGNMILHRVDNDMIRVTLPDLNRHGGHIQVYVCEYPTLVRRWVLSDDGWTINDLRVSERLIPDSAYGRSRIGAITRETSCFEFEDALAMWMYRQDNLTERVHELRDVMLRVGRLAEEE